VPAVPIVVLSLASPQTIPIAKVKSPVT